ncbi:MAG: LysM peptidoglycan-binding domain-containing protein [Lachnospiraceae bacterium]|nr:LysM peptidoglycan-binding domain-containing protein [Lachnospiraceae bacterium]
MAKDLYQNTKRNEKTDANERRRRNKKRGNRIIGIAVLGLAIAACGAPSGRMDGNPDGWENSDIGNDSDMEMLLGEGDIGEELKEWPKEHDSCEVQELSSYLYEHTSASPYAGAEITIKNYEGEQLETEWDEPSAFRFAGEADITWRFHNSLAEMETALNETAMQETDGNALHFLYYTFPMTENDHALDLYHVLKRKFDTKEHPLSAWSVDNGKLFYYIQETMQEEDGYELFYLHGRNSKVNLYVKDRTAYGLTLLNPPSEGDNETLEYLFVDIFQHYGALGSGWGLDEESLYWIDHEERLTELENPKRSFLEVRGIDENWESAGDEGIMRYFGLLVEADYELPLTEDGRMLSLHFSLAGEDENEEITFSDFIDDLRKDTIISAASSLTESGDETLVDEKEMSAAEEDTELRYYLLNGFCMDEAYDMTVTDMETGEVLQERRVSLSIELPDTITYPDLNGDGYADMRVGTPVHMNGEKAMEEYYSPPTYLLWNPQIEQFERKTEKEVENSRRAVANGLTEEKQEEKTKRERVDSFAPVQELPEGADPKDYIKLTGDNMLEYEVQEGDSLWRISERFYGIGYQWPTIVRTGDAPEDPNYLLVGETVFVPEIFYIRKDPFSRGGLSSKGSFQIEQPDGFAYYFLNGDLTYVPWEEENQIHSLPITNPVGKNPFHEPEDWEAFQAEATRCSEELCPGRVSNLTFEKSHMEDGCDLYGYSFEYDTGEETIEYVDFFKFGKDNMAEVIGVRKQEPNTVLVNTVRYVAASFTDYGGEPGMGWGDGTIPNVGADQWEYPYLHNLFEAAREQFETDN